MALPPHPRVLLVDDDPDAHFLTQRTLRRGAGVEDFVDAYDGREGIEALCGGSALGGAERITHVVLDMQMPVLDGFGFLEAFDRLPARVTDGVRVVMLSNSPNPDHHDRARRHACVGAVLEKALHASDCAAVLGGPTALGAA